MERTLSGAMENKVGPGDGSGRPQTSAEKAGTVAILQEAAVSPALVKKKSGKKIIQKKGNLRLRSSCRRLQLRRRFFSGLHETLKPLFSADFILSMHMAYCIKRKQAQGKGASPNLSGIQSGGLIVEEDPGEGSSHMPLELDQGSDWFG